jgi:hypothetical protein
MKPVAPGRPDEPGLVLGLHCPDCGGALLPSPQDSCYLICPCGRLLGVEELAEADAEGLETILRYWQAKLESLRALASGPRGSDGFGQVFHNHIHSLEARIRRLRGLGKAPKDRWR